MFGFLLGFSVASAFAAYHLLDEYKLASNTLQASIEELHATAQKVIVFFFDVLSFSIFYLIVLQ
jgi:hypothetical protein